MSRAAVLISLDTLRTDCIGCYPARLFRRSYPELQPPRTACLDELAQRGTFFTNCISAAPYTSASHGAYFTGQWPLRNGLYEVFNRKLGSETLFERAAEAGYRTTFKTDFPLILGPDLGFDRGVQDYLVEDDEAFLRALQRSEPCVAFAHFGGIHYPYGFHNLGFGGEDYRRKLEELEERYPVDGFEFRDKIDETYRDHEDRQMLLRYKRIVQYMYSEKRYDDLFSLYLEGITYFLENRFAPFLARVLEALEGREHLLAVFADHGEQWDDLSYGHHNTLKEGVLRVPLLLSGTGLAEGRMLDGRVRTVDLAATVAEWLDLPGGDRMDGSSLLDRLGGGSEPAEQPRAFAQAYNCEPDAFTRMQERIARTGRKTGSLKHVLTQEAVYDGDYKLVRRHYTYENGIFGLLPETRDELFRIDADLGIRRVSDPARAADMGVMLEDYNRAHANQGTRAATREEIAAYLRDFGYGV